MLIVPPPLRLLLVPLASLEEPARDLVSRAQAACDEDQRGAMLRAFAELHALLIPAIDALVEKQSTVSACLGPVSYTHLDVYKRQGEAVPQSPFQDAPPSLRQQELAVRRQLVKSQRRGDLVEQAACYLHLGDIQLSRGDSELAGDLYRQALKLSQTAHDSRQAVARSK